MTTIDTDAIQAIATRLERSAGLSLSNVLDRDAATALRSLLAEVARLTEGIKRSAFPMHDKCGGYDLTRRRDLSDHPGVFYCEDCKESCYDSTAKQVMKERDALRAEVAAFDAALSDCHRVSGRGAGRDALKAGAKQSTRVTTEHALEAAKHLADAASGPAATFFEAGAYATIIDFIEQAAPVREVAADPEPETTTAAEDAADAAGKDDT